MWVIRVRFAALVHVLAKWARVLMPSAESGLRSL
jgi:hypothetical protein